jgi:hypothetical protein
LKPPRDHTSSANIGVAEELIKAASNKPRRAHMIFLLVTHVQFDGRPTGFKWNAGRCGEVLGDPQQ